MLPLYRLNATDTCSLLFHFLQWRRVVKAHHLEAVSSFVFSRSEGYLP